MEAASEEDDTPILDSVQAGHLGDLHQVLGEALEAALAEDFPVVEDHPEAVELVENFKGVNIEGIPSKSFF